MILLSQVRTAAGSRISLRRNASWKYSVGLCGLFKSGPTAASPPPLIGWQQDNFDNNITPSENESGVLFSLIATELYLYFSRARSIGYLSGPDIQNLASNSTEDSVGFNVGAAIPAMVQRFGNMIYFGDALGRPYLFQPGTPPRALWEQLRSVSTAAATGFPNTTAIVATSAFETTRNLYVAAIWSDRPTTQQAPTSMVVFDAATGIYQGLWAISGNPGIECLGTFIDKAGRATMLAFTPGGFLWALSGIGSSVNALTTTDGNVLTTTDGRWLTTTGQPDNWKDDGAIPERFIQTDRLGFSDTVLFTIAPATVVTSSPAPCVVSVGTSAMTNTVEGTPSPVPSSDGTYRLLVGCEAQGRGPAVKVQPTTADDQWMWQSVSLRAVPSLVGPDDS